MINDPAFTALTKLLRHERKACGRKIVHGGGFMIAIIASLALWVFVFAIGSRST